jgi:hypothetical protein
MKLLQGSILSRANYPMKKEERILTPEYPEADKSITLLLAIFFLENTPGDDCTQNTRTVHLQQCAENCARHSLRATHDE